MEYETPIMEVTFFGGKVRTSVVDASNIKTEDNNVDAIYPF